MKSLFLIRHAKSSWELNKEDIERPLNKRGLSDAPMMAKKMHNRISTIDAIFSSPAVRAFTTAISFAEEFGYNKKEIVTIPSLYLAKPEIYKTIIDGMDESLSSVAIFAHNPGITDFVNSLTNVQVDDMPTCAIYAVQSSTEIWKSFLRSPLNFLFFDYPKAL